VILGQRRRSRARAASWAGSPGGHETDETAAPGFWAPGEWAIPTVDVSAANGMLCDIPRDLYKQDNTSRTPPVTWSTDLTLCSGSV
jgi:hypothetical protein